MDLEGELRVFVESLSIVHFRMKAKILAYTAENISNDLAAYRENLSSEASGSSSVPFSIPDTNYQTLLEIALRHANTNLQEAFSDAQAYSLVHRNLSTMKDYLHLLSTLPN